MTGHVTRVGKTENPGHVLFCNVTSGANGKRKFWLYTSKVDTYRSGCTVPHILNNVPFYSHGKYGGRDILEKEKNSCPCPASKHDSSVVQTIEYNTICH